MFRNFIFQNFPFLENDFDALTDYQLFCKFMGYVKKLAKDNEEFSKKIEEFESYFDNLDVQDEINNKLDEMLANGDFDDMISYLTGTTLLNVVESEPEEKVENSLYELISYDENIIGNFKNSFHYLDCMNNNRYNADIENNILKVCSFNIENEDIFYTIGIEGVEKYNKLSYILDKISCDIIGINELTINKIIRPEMLLNNFTNHITFGSSNLDEGCFEGDYGNAIISHPISSSHSSGIYDASYSGTNGYIKNVYNINNKSISFYCTHFNWLSQEVIKEQIEELYAIVSNDDSEYKIIVGDFNFYLENYNEYLTDFINAGYKLVNAGTIPTIGNLAVDEIMVSSNIDIIDSGNYTSDFIDEISDHKPIWAKIFLGGNE